MGTGQWNAASGASGGWGQWEVDLAPYAGQQIELSIAYASDWATQGLGVFIDDVNLLGEETSFEAVSTAGRSPVRRMAAPQCQQFPAHHRRRLPRGVAVAMDESVLMGYGIEGITGKQAQADVAGRTMQYLLR